MKKRIALLFCAVAMLFCSVATSDIQMTQANETKLAEEKDLASIRLPEEVDLHTTNKPSISHVKGRKSADPNEFLKTTAVESPVDHELKIVSEGNSISSAPVEPGITYPGRKSALDNNTTKSVANNVVSEVSPPKEVIRDENSTIAQKNATKSNNSTMTVTSHDVVNAEIGNTTLVKAHNNSTSTANINATTAAKTTTTTQKPKKPKITLSIDELPSKVKAAAPVSKLPTEKLNVDEPEQPIAQPSQEFDPSPVYHGRTDYIIPIVSLIFAVPILMGAVIIIYRRVKDYWSTRHYRRMDFLVDGMYND